MSPERQLFDLFVGANIGPTEAVNGLLRIHDDEQLLGKTVAKQFREARQEAGLPASSYSTLGMHLARSHSQNRPFERQASSSGRKQHHSAGFLYHHHSADPYTV
jgi:hypothetical protein